MDDGATGVELDPLPARECVEPVVRATVRPRQPAAEEGRNRGPGTEAVGGVLEVPGARRGSRRGCNGAMETEAQCGSQVERCLLSMCAKAVLGYRRHMGV